jgi:hypothetical protein
MKAWYRYHRYIDNVKVIKNFPVSETPIGWIRGTGTVDPITLNKLIASNHRNWKGIPKSIEQKEKMSLAKLGKPKSEQHKQSLKKAWQARKLQQATETNNTTTNFSRPN